MARNGMKNILVLLISMAVVLIAVIAFIYKPPKYITGKHVAQKSDLPEEEKETVDDE